MDGNLIVAPLTEALFYLETGLNYLHDMKNRLAIYLIKPEFTTVDDIADVRTPPIPIGEIGDFLFKESHPYRPDWAERFFGAELGADIPLITSSASGLFIVPVQVGGTTVRFALAFGMGRHLLKEGVYEDRFGLKVVLNSIEPENWRSIEKTSLGSVPKHSREQMSRDVASTDFGIDIEQDLVSTITARSKDELLGKTITGKDSLSVSVEVAAGNVREFLSHCHERFESEDYKRDFDWIDQIKDIRDGALETRLNGKLIEKIKAEEFEKIWMAVPETIDWADTKGFRYLRPRRAELRDDISIEAFVEALGERDVDLPALKAKSIYRISVSTDDVADSWSAYRCLYAEIEESGKLYLLNNGKWYEIAPDFTTLINDHFAAVPRSELAMPQCESNDEETYNKVAAVAMTNCTCLDRKNVQHGGGHNKVEFCDLITSDRKLIHVKRYGGSSVLSHLFNQGTHASELFVSDGDFRRKVNEILPDGLKLPNPQANIKASDYEIVYAIVSKSPKDLDIPFFSKVSLRNACRRLSSFGYGVSIKKVQKVSPAVEQGAAEEARS